jgi:predicted DNA binding CopG/RHH family protein
MNPRLPNFKKMSDIEIAKFWDEHDAAEFWPEIAAEKEAFADKRPKKSISMRFDIETLEQLREIAAAKGIGYQTLIRMWIKERLKKEAS